MLSLFKDLFTFKGFDMGYSAEYQRAYQEQTAELERRKRRYETNKTKFYKMLEHEYGIDKEEAKRILVIAHEDMKDIDFDSDTCPLPSPLLKNAINIFDFGVQTGLFQQKQEIIAFESRNFRQHFLIIQKRLENKGKTTDTCYYPYSLLDGKTMKVTYEILEEQK